MFYNTKSPEICKGKKIQGARCILADSVECIGAGKNSLPVYRSTSRENTRYKMQADSYNAGGKCEEENTENKLKIKKLRRTDVSPV
jgi:hypothetical protein